MTTARKTATKKSTARKPRKAAAPAKGAKITAAKGERIEKRRVEFYNSSEVLNPENGEVIGIREETHVDFIPVDWIDAWKAEYGDRWQRITVGEAHDPGPGGDDGETTMPEAIRVRLEGK